MSYCVNCGVELDPSLNECPLCNTPVLNPNSPRIEEPVPSFPADIGRVDTERHRDLGIFISVVLSATALSCILLNFLFYRESPWSVIVTGICICLFVFLIPAVIYSKLPVYVSLLFDISSVALYLYMISFLTRNHRWFFGLGFPTVFLFGFLVEIYALCIRHIHLTLLSGALAFFIEVPVFCVLLEILINMYLGQPLSPSWSAVVTTVCLIIDISLFTIIKKKRLRNEVRRRLHF